MTPSFVLFFMIELAIQVLLWFYLNFRVFCSISVKNVLGKLVDNALNLQIALGNMDILTMLILTTHKYEISFISWSSSISFSTFSGYRSFTSLIKHIPRYLILYSDWYIGYFLKFILYWFCILQL